VIVIGQKPSTSMTAWAKACGGFLGQVVPDAARDGPVFVLAGELDHDRDVIGVFEAESAARPRSGLAGATTV